jgi:hypothetical protein
MDDFEERALKQATQKPLCNKQAVLATLVHRARALCDKDSLRGELEFLKTTFKENGSSCKQIQCALNPKVRTSKPKDKPTPATLLPYVQTAYCCLSRMLARHNIKNVGLLPRKISQLPPSFEGRSGAEDSRSV